MQILDIHYFKPKNSNTETVITLFQNKYIDGVRFVVECESRQDFLDSKHHSMFNKRFQSEEEAREFYDLVKNNLLTIFDRID